MKIVFISGPEFADCEFPLIREFQRQNIDVYYFCLLAEYNKCHTIIDIKNIKPKNEILSMMEYAEMRIFSSYINMDKLFFINKVHKRDSHPLSLYLYRKLFLRISEINPDAIITTKPFYLAGLQLYKFREKTTFIVHDPFPHIGNFSLRDSFFRWLCFRLTKKIVILNPVQLETFCESYRIRRQDILLNSLGTYDVLNVFRQNGKPECPIENNILFFGRFAPYKGIDYLCKAMEKVLNIIPDATLTIAGRGKMSFDSKAYESMKNVNIINRHIPTEELVMLIERSTVVCCPYIGATQSGVVMTSFTFHKPIVATKVGGLESYIENGETGILVPPRDVDALANALVNVLQHPELIEFMDNNIRRKYLMGEYSWETIARKYIDFCN